MKTFEGIPKYAIRVYFGSSEPEYNIFDGNWDRLGFWSCYHDGPLPKGILVYNQTLEPVLK